MTERESSECLLFFYCTALSFLVPIVQLLSSAINSTALILSPTRELCLQLEEQAKLLMKGEKRTHLSAPFLQICVNIILFYTFDECKIKYQEPTTHLSPFSHTGLPDMLTAAIIGGVPIPHQLHRLKSNIQVKRK